jgi:hypothetical protein
MHTTVMLMPTVPTPRARSTVPVIRDTREMESRVLVRAISGIFQYFFHQQSIVF